MEKKILINNRDGQKLAAVFHIPDNKTEKIVILSHSFKGDKDCDTLIKNFAVRVCQEGFMAIRFDCYGTGESDGQFIEATVTSEVEDLEDVIQFVKQEGYEDICLAGLSQGAAMSILATDENIKCLVLWSPAFDLSVLYKRYKAEFSDKDFIIKLKNRTGEKVQVGRKMWKEFNTIKLDDKLLTIKQPTLIIHGEKDYLHFNLDKIKEYVAKFFGLTKLEVIQDADHDFLDSQKEKEVIDLSIEWVKKYL